MSLDHAWLKGVPMELRPRYYPKPPLRFKDIDIYIPLDAIENDYDFTEERRVLAESKMYEEYKENERLAEEERLRLLAIEAERLRLEEEERELLRQQEEEEQENIRLLQQEERAKELALAAASESADNNSPASAAVDNPSAFDDDGQPPPPTYQEALSKENENNLASPTATTIESPSSSVENHLPSSSSSHQLSQQQPEASGVTTAAPTPSESETAVISPHNGYQYSDIQLPMYHQHHHHQPIQSYYNYYAALPPQPQPQPPPHQIQATTSVPPLQYQQTSQNLGGGGGGGILQPQPPPPPPGGEASASASGAGSPSGSDKSSASQTHPHNPPPHLSKKVDLSDFESDTANPFDNVELKSINDMEVLASVLKNNMNINTTPNPTNLPHHQQQQQHQHHPNSHSSSSAPESSHQNPAPPYVNGYERGPPPTYYHQPTPIYPPVSQHQQCPYPSPAWNQNGYFPLPTSSSSTPAVAVTTTGGGGATAPPPHLNQNRPVSTGSHVPSPTPNMEQNHVPPRAPAEVNSFTKQHFPFLTSMAATQARRDRDVSLTGGYGAYGHHRGYTQSKEEITSQNPFLSNYISSSSAPPHPQQLSHSPMQHQHQYWPSQLQQTQQQNLYPLNHNSGVGTTPQGATGGTLDPQNQSQHALR